jgi:hypothetical protein
MKQVSENQRPERALGFGALSLIVVAAASLAGQLATYPNLEPWYAGLTKPSLTIDPSMNAKAEARMQIVKTWRGREVVTVLKVGRTAIPQSGDDACLAVTLELIVSVEVTFDISLQSKPTSERNSIKFNRHFDFKGGSVWHPQARRPTVRFSDLLSVRSGVHAYALRTRGLFAKVFVNAQSRA